MPLVKPMDPGSIFHHINLPTLSYFYYHLFYFASLFLFIIKIQKYYLIISIRSHSRKWPRRAWQPLHRVGCEVLICLCRRVGLVHDLLLDWYLCSQKLREILMLLYCITLSSSRENQRSAQEVAEPAAPHWWQVRATRPLIASAIEVVCRLRAPPATRPAFQTT